jgi:cellulose synthase/poly-beta-1,6-N-acetylglucosamine synthase-like glycosyltransferase
MDITFGNIIVYTAIFIALYVIILWLIVFWKNKDNIYKPKLKKNHPSVCIIIPCFNEEKTIIKTVRSLLNLDYPKDKLEIMIINDGSTDKTYQKAKKLLKYKQVKLFHKKNEGKWVALNYGITKTEAEFIGCLDADSFVAPDALKLVMTYFTDKKIMAVTSALKVYQPKNIIQYIQKIEYIFAIIQRKILAWLNSITVIPGPFSIYRKKIFEKVGLFVRGHNTEDMEMALRIQSKNYRITNVPNASVYTITPASLKALQRQRERWYQGLVKNFWDYRYIFMNKKYKDLGLFIFPIIPLTLLVFIIMTFYILFSFIQNMINNFILWQAVGFNFNQPIFDLNWFFLNTSTLIFVIFFSLAFTTALFLLGKKISNENLEIKKDLKYFLFFIFLYGPLLLIWWLGAIRATLSKERKKW